MPNTMTLISSVTVPSAQASMDFNSIPSTYTDLKLFASMRVTDGGEGTTPPISRCELIINGITTGTSYNVNMLYGIPGAVPSVNSAGGLNSSRNFYSGAADSSNATAGVFSNALYTIQNYASSTLPKAILIDNAIENMAKTCECDIRGGSWNSTSAITSLSLRPYNLGNFAQYTTAYLYGIVKS